MSASYWQSSANVRTFPRIFRHAHCDVVVIGGGLTGITAAYLLKKEGRRVFLLDRARLATADTGHTTAHLTCVTDKRLTDLVKTFGDDHARAVWDAGLAAIWQIAEIVRDERISCGFDWVSGYLHLPVIGPERSDSDIEDLQREAGIAADLGFDAHFTERAPFVDRPAVEYPNQARFDPRKYLRALVEEIDGDGSAIFENSAVTSVTDSPLTVVADGYRLNCDRVVIATHNPIVGKAGVLNATLLQTKLALYSSYAVAAHVAKGQVADALFWDTGDPYFYQRLVPEDGHDVVILGGEDHKTGQERLTEGRMTALEKALHAMIPDAEVHEHWSGQVIETNDGLPYIGEMTPHQFAATGFSGNGMTFGTVGAMMARDWVLGTGNPWSDLFDLGRTKVRGGLWDYLKENKDYPYYLIRDRFAGAQGKSTRSIPRNGGRVIELEGRQVAAYRHDDGTVTLRSATCTHMGCRVNWNDSQHTWDCPCHGSRFSPTGDVLAGPAEKALAEIEVEHPVPNRR
jgi:glycine/D-amino acid oxidase-like deaminating enzyme/nitrite reductase/ring-hydroxylating ferredoxin subunit